jgi:hypothetical protein
VIGKLVQLLLELGSFLRAVIWASLRQGRDERYATFAPGLGDHLFLYQLAHTHTHTHTVDNENTCT